MRAIFILFAICLLLTSCYTYKREPVFGYACGESGIPPKHAPRAEVLYKNKNTRGLKRWLNSKNPVLNAYAVNCFYHLKEKESYKIDAEMLTRIGQVKKDTTTIKTCSGCLVSHRSVSDALQYCVFE